MDGAWVELTLEAYGSTQHQATASAWVADTGSAERQWALGRERKRPQKKIIIGLALQSVGAHHELARASSGRVLTPHGKLA